MVVFVCILLALIERMPYTSEQIHAQIHTYNSNKHIGDGDNGHLMGEKQRTRYLKGCSILSSIKWMKLIDIVYIRKMVKV